MPQLFKAICIGIDLLVLVIMVLRQLTVVLQRRAQQKNDPLRYLRGKSREEIGRILRTPVYDDLPPKTRPRPQNKTKQTDRKP
jgi:hypothetical protein